VNVVQRNGDWNCSCGEMNFASRINCRKCGIAKNMINSSVSTSNIVQNPISTRSTYNNNIVPSMNTLPTSSVSTNVIQKSGDWYCPCGEMNFASRDNCRRCNRSKNKNSSSVNVVQKSGDWNCSCGEMNFASRTKCRKCKLDKNVNNVSYNPVTTSSMSSYSNTQKSGDWNCSCGEMNFASRDNCRRCGISKNMINSSVSTNIVQNSVPSFTYNYSVMNTIPMNTIPMNTIPTSSVSTNVVQKNGDWNCSCGEMNFASRINCRTCGLGCKKRSDWYCNCGEFNSGSNECCIKCGIKV